MEVKTLFALGIIFYCGLSHATTTKRLSFNDIVHEAAVCVIAKAKAITYIEKNNAPYTLTTFTVREVAFGSAPSEVRVATPGGPRQNTKYPVAVVNAGVPRFLIGSSNMLLLNKSKVSNYYSVVGFNQGIFNVSAEGVSLPEATGGIVPEAKALKLVDQLRNQNKK